MYTEPTYDILRCVHCGNIVESYMLSDFLFCPECLAPNPSFNVLYKDLEHEEEYWESHREKKGKEENEK